MNAAELPKTQLFKCSVFFERLFLTINKARELNFITDITPISSPYLNRGVLFNSQFSFVTHTNYITKTSVLNISSIAKIRPFLSLPGVDNSIAVFYDLLWLNSTKLQLVQNCGDPFLIHTIHLFFVECVCLWISLNSGFKPLKQFYPQQFIHITCDSRNQITV